MFERLPDPVELEEQVLAFWAQNRIFEAVLAQSKGRPRFVFFEGPPTANGTPHNGHVLTRVIKDVFPRYKTMRGFHVDRKAGWDTHGLPVEVEVEKQLGIHGREQIEALGLESFSRRCVDSVFTYVEEWEELTRNIGFWVDLDQAYVTFHKSYVESVWWALSELYRRGLLYQGHKVVWWWPQGGTTLSAGEVGMGYREVEDPAITVRFRDAEDPSVSYLGWTTTPWTLPSNVALAVGEDIDYAFCEVEGETFVVAAPYAAAMGWTPVRTVKGRELKGRRYRPLYEFEGGNGRTRTAGRFYEIVTGRHVSATDGTGIVHTAPAFGEDDMRAAKENGLGILQWIEPNGCFHADCGFVAGMFCKEADKPIIRDLQERGLLLKRETVRHPYPFCWRADDDPLIQYARPAWFIRTTDFVSDVLANNAAVGWLPEHIREGRFGDFLRNNVDWALSRERFWGTPLPIWVCPSCDARLAVSSIAELRERGATGFASDLDEHLQVHRPWIDAIVVPCGCGGAMRRVPEVIDCWFDSGCMPFAQWGFPHRNVEVFRDNFPADFISEAVDQTRGWFYSLIMIATMLFDAPTCDKYGLPAASWPRPFKNCLVLGHVCDMDGRKESKSKGNYTSPNLVLRGQTKLKVRADDAVRRGTVGLLKDQVRSLDLAKDELVTLYAPGCPSVALKAAVAPAAVKEKEACHLNPEDLASLGAHDGDVLWFRIPIAPPGADSFRWLFCSSSPAWSNTRLSLRAIRDGQREFLIRLRNVVQFFGIYAAISAEKGEFDPRRTAPRPVSQRHLLDRWVTSELCGTLAAVQDHLDAYRLFEASREVLAFVDALSNWYVRRSRTRFWGEGPDLQDALWTLYEVLVATSQMIAPFVPFHAEAIYRTLTSMRPEAPISVHLCAWPTVDASLRDDTLSRDMALVREIASLGLAARAASKVKVRQPLRAVTVVLADRARRSAVERFTALLCDELNVREVRFADQAADYVQYQVKPNFQKLGPALGKDVKRVAQALSGMDPASVKARLDAGTLSVDVGDRSVALSTEDVQVTVLARGEYQAASSPVAVVALSTALDDDLKAEGFVRELVNRVQSLRKELDLGYTQRIALQVDGGPVVQEALARFGDTLAAEVLARRLTVGPPDESAVVRTWEVEGQDVRAGVLPL